MKITLNPIKEVLITNFVKSTIEDMIKNRAINEVVLSWCDGYLYFSYDEDDEFVIKEKYKGILYLEYFVYAECKEKITQSKWNGYNVEVLDTSTVTLFNEIVKAIPKLEDNNQ